MRITKEQLRNVIHDVILKESLQQKIDHATFEKFVEHVNVSIDRVQKIIDLVKIYVSDKDVQIVLRYTLGDYICEDFQSREELIRCMMHRFENENLSFWDEHGVDLLITAPFDNLLLIFHVRQVSEKSYGLYYAVNPHEHLQPFAISWLIRQSSCSNFDEMDQKFIDGIMNFIDKGILELKVNADVDVDLG